MPSVARSRLDGRLGRPGRSTPSMSQVSSPITALAGLQREARSPTACRSRRRRRSRASAAAHHQRVARLAEAGRDRDVDERVRGGAVRARQDADVVPPACLAPRQAASITPPRPPQTTTAPRSASRRPTSSAARARPVARADDRDVDQGRGGASARIVGSSSGGGGRARGGASRRGVGRRPSGRYRGPASARFHRDRYASRGQHGSEEHQRRSRRGQATGRCPRPGPRRPAGG